MSEYTHISGFLEFASHKQITSVIIALKASEHLLEEDGCYYFLDERGHVVDTCDPEGVIDIDTFTIEFPSRNYRNLSSRLMGLLNEYHPSGELRIHSEGSMQVLAYLDGDSLMESKEQVIIDLLDRSGLSDSEKAEHLDKCKVCLSGDYEAFEATGYGAESEFNGLVHKLLLNASSVLMGRLRERITEAA